MPSLIRYLDIVVLPLVLPIFILGNLSLLGYAVGAAAWVAQRVLERFLKAQAEASEDPKRIVGLTAGGAIGRGWLVAFTILGVGLANRDAGLAAAVLIMGLFTIYFIVGLITHSAQEGDIKS